MLQRGSLTSPRTLYNTLKPIKSPFTENKKQEKINKTENLQVSREKFLWRSEPGQVWEPVASDEGTSAARGHCEPPGGTLPRRAPGPPLSRGPRLGHVLDNPGDVLCVVSAVLLTGQSVSSFGTCRRTGDRGKPSLSGSGGPGTLVCGVELISCSQRWLLCICVSLNLATGGGLQTGLI